MDFQNISRRNFIKGGLAVATVGAVGTGAYGHEIEPDHLSIERKEFSLAGLRPEFDGFVIALLADIHYGSYVDQVLNSAVQAANSAQPDLVLLGGDFISWHHDTNARLIRDANSCAQMLAGIKSRYGSLAVLGNHDYSRKGDMVTDTLTTHGITVLKNASSPVEKNNARLWIGGIDDVLEGRPDLTATFKDVPREESKILLAHEPDFADDVKPDYQVDLQLSGHSHGGQVRIPLLGAPILPELGEKYSMGSYQVGAMQLYTNRGLGMGTPHFRLNCPPELTLITLRSMSSHNRTA